jgi:HEAT repeat protein
MQDLIVKALEDKNYNVRSEAIMALGELSNPKSIAILEKFLKDNKYDIWASAAIINIISPD